MSQTKYTVLAAVFMLCFLGARVVNLGLGGFSIGVLMIAAIFGLLAVVTPSQEGHADG